MSYWRRLFQARLDMLSRGNEVDTADVRSALQEVSSAHDAGGPWVCIRPTSTPRCPKPTRCGSQVVDPDDEEQCPHTRHCCRQWSSRCRPIVGRCTARSMR